MRAGKIQGKEEYSEYAVVGVNVKMSQKCSATNWSNSSL
jgi:hypothetical protein